jgi:dihydropteroate synthase
MISQLFKCGRFDLDLGMHARPLVMGILNVTPDSFSDGGQFLGLEAALSHAEQMLADGVDIIDIGGESSRPGAVPLSLEQELARVMPLVYALRDCGKPLSIDTYKPQVMREALAAGADMINDIKGFRESGALAAVGESDCGLCIMHMQKASATMQVAPHYDDVAAEVAAFLAQRVAEMAAAGIERSRICIDPGFGFGKTLGHNVDLFRGMRRLRDSSGLPVLAGVSRKAMIGELTGRPAGQRLAGSVVAALAAARQGARILRVHDVAETVDALAVWQALAPASDQLQEQTRGELNDA